MLLFLLAGCAGPPPVGVNVRDGRGYCPICVMWHDAAEMRWPIDFKGRRYAFCDPNCRAKFEKEPENYLKDAEFNPKQ